MNNHSRSSDRPVRSRTLAGGSGSSCLVTGDFEKMLRQRLVGRVAMMGIGNMMRSDDGFGPHLVHSLQSAHIPSRVKLCSCETAPENFVGPVVAFQPNTIIMIDAAELAEPPGTVRLIRSNDMADLSTTTHDFSLRLLAQVLESTTNAQVFLLAVQPKHTSFGTRLSSEALHTLHHLTETFHRVL